MIDITIKQSFNHGAIIRAFARKVNAFWQHPADWAKDISVWAKKERLRATQQQIAGRASLGKQIDTYCKRKPVFDRYKASKDRET